MSLEMRDTKCRDIVAVEIMKKNFSIKYDFYSYNNKITINYKDKE